MYCGIPTFRAPTGILKVVANFAAKFETMELSEVIIKRIV